MGPAAMNGSGVCEAEMAILIGHCHRYNILNLTLNDGMIYHSPLIPLFQRGELVVEREESPSFYRAKFHFPLFDYSL